MYFLEGQHFETIVFGLILSPRDDSTLGPYFVGGPYVDIGTPQLPLPNERLYSTVLRVERIKRAIVEAITKHDGDKAAEAMRSHVADVSRRLRARLEHSQ